jgi:hypothetical protein
MPDWAKGRRFSPMPHSHPLPFPNRRLLAWLAIASALVLAALAGRALMAQVEGDRGIAPVMSSGDIEVMNVRVDVRGDNADDARAKGWAEAEKKAWESIGGPSIPEGQLTSMVTAVLIQREQIGPRRYIATLGVIFDRARAGRLLGRDGVAQRSAPMLLVPVTFAGGSELVYETRNPWQRAWAEYQAGASRIDYVRPSGAGGDSLLINYGQTGRRSRTWWRNVLDQFDAADVLVPIARLDYEYPGGPVRGTFTARYGPSNTFLDGFTLTARNPDQLPQMLDQAVQRFNRIFESALADGKLRPDPTLSLGVPEVDPALQRLLELGRLAEAQERAARAAAAAEATDGETPGEATPTPTPQAGSSYTIQFATPDAGSFDAALSAVRATPGVRGAATTSVGIGGTSVMSVSFAGSLDQLAAALRARGFTVTQGSSTLSIRR